MCLVPVLDLRVVMPIWVGMDVLYRLFRLRVVTVRMIIVMVMSTKDF